MTPEQISLKRFISLATVEDMGGYKVIDGNEIEYVIYKYRREYVRIWFQNNEITGEHDIVQPFESDKVVFKASKQIWEVVEPT